MSLDLGVAVLGWLFRGYCYNKSSTISTAAGGLHFHLSHLPALELFMYVWFIISHAKKVQCCHGWWYYLKWKKSGTEKIIMCYDVFIFAITRWESGTSVRTSWDIAKVWLHSRPGPIKQWCYITKQFKTKKQWDFVL